MAKRTLNDRIVTTLKVSGITKDGKPRDRLDVMDALVPGFGVRVTSKGQRTYILAGRFPGRPYYTRRELGDVGALALTDARSKARSWIELIGQGKDPAAEEARIERENLRRQENTFLAVAEEYIRLVIVGPDETKPKQRKGPEIARVIRSVFILLWGERPITEITRHDVLTAIEAVRDHGTAKMLASHGIKVKQRKGGRGNAGRAPAQARNLLGSLKTLFSWAIERGTYGLEVSPCDHLRSARIIGEKESGDRVLSDDEIFAFWRATGRMGYPAGPLYQLLLLTGLRLNEVADGRWTEFDPAVMRAIRQRPENQSVGWTKLKSDQLAWVIPGDRMKGKNGKVRPHVVPLTTDVLEILEILPHFKRGDYLFSTTFGEKPVWIGDKVKNKLDLRMLRTIRALTRRRGEDPRRVGLPHWINHDLRRTLRTGLSALRVDREVREAVLAHVKPGIEGVYDLYDLLDEKRHALELWAVRLRSIVTAQSNSIGNVVPLTVERG
jgi:integrase